MAFALLSSKKYIMQSTTGRIFGHLTKKKKRQGKTIVSHLLLMQISIYRDSKNESLAGKQFFSLFSAYFTAISCTSQNPAS